MFVCNKIDTSAGAQTFDTRSSDETDSDEEETERKVDKQKIVFAQLQHHGLIAESESYDSCSLFYGISAQNVREDRRKKTSSRATELFSKFEEGLSTVLEETVKRQANQVVNKLVFLQRSLVHAMGRTRQVLPHMLGIPLEFDTAKGVEKSLYDSLTATIGSEEKIEMVVNCNLVNLEEKFMREAVHLHTTEQVSPAQELETRKNYLLLLKENSKFTLNKEDVPFLRFLIVLRGLVLDRTFNDLKRTFGGFVDRAKEVVEVHSRNIINPLLRHAFGVAYGSSLPETKNSSLPNKPSLELPVLLTSVVTMFTPAAAHHSVGMLLLVRVLEGFGQVNTVVIFSKFSKLKLVNDYFHRRDLEVA